MWSYFVLRILYNCSLSAFSLEQSMSKSDEAPLFGLTYSFLWFDPTPGLQRL